MKYLHIRITQHLHSLTASYKNHQQEDISFHVKHTEQKFIRCASLHYDEEKSWLGFTGTISTNRQHHAKRLSLSSLMGDNGNKL